MSKEQEHHTATTSVDANAEVETPNTSLFEDQEVSYATLNQSLHRLADILEQPRTSKESFHAIKFKKEHVDFLLKETLLSKVEVEGLLTRSSGDLSAAIKLFLDSPFNTSFKIKS